MEVERALLEGEHQNEMEKLQEDQGKIQELRHKQNILMEKASRQREKVNQCYVHLYSRVAHWNLITAFYITCTVYILHTFNITPV